MPSAIETLKPGVGNEERPPINAEQQELNGLPVIEKAADTEAFEAQLASSTAQAKIEVSSARAVIEEAESASVVSASASAEHDTYMAVINIKDPSKIPTTIPGRLERLLHVDAIASAHDFNEVVGHLSDEYRKKMSGNAHNN